MKPIISHSDYSTLKSLIANCPQHFKSSEIQQLVEELEKAEVIADQKLEDDIIKLNSRFEAEDVATKKKWKLTLTLPAQANLKDQKISVFSPLGVALIGFKKGMIIQWTLPGGLKQIRILDVKNE